MTASDSTRLERVRQELLIRARVPRHPLQYLTVDQIAPVLARLESLDREHWAETFRDGAEPYERAAAEAEAANDAAAAARQYLVAYDLYHMARFPAPNSPGKLGAYRRAQQMHRQAVRWLKVDMERVEIPFGGRPGEGRMCVALLRKPSEVQRPAVLITWGGIDTFKEERERGADPFLAAGLAVLAIDMPGVGDAPLSGSTDAERLWDPVFDWIESRSDLDAARVGVLGLSTGGYWATKLAHTRRERIRCAINHGGPAHFAFQPDWIARAEDGEYLMELSATLASAFGGATYDDWVRIAPTLSLLDLGILDQPCAPLLLWNGVDDTVFPIQDMHLLLEHGDPKLVRFAPGGHMGYVAETLPTMLAFLGLHLG
ncbi:MAG: alpha/beta fold hydrolase [Chloroflexi bacterium]|nr:alpha/beta fold hydrolase [Chloroflexota bacterium]